MAVKICSARIDENNKAHGGKAGDQTGKEVSTQNWYLHGKEWVVLRAKDAAAREKIAEDMEFACDNRNIGYDQYQRDTLYNVSKPLGFNCKKVTTPCETDCSALVRVCVCYAGIAVGNFRTTNQASVLMATGKFEKFTDDAHCKKSANLLRGDILVTRSQGHTVVVLTDGSNAKAERANDPGKADGALRRGDEGSAVMAMQANLLAWKADCLPVWGADGDFGEETEAAVKAFQKSAGLPVTGVYDETTRKALTMDDKATKCVTVTGGSVNVRSGPGMTNRVLGVVHSGDRLPWQGEDREVDGTAWHLVEYKNQNGWISGKYAKVELT